MTSKYINAKSVAFVAVAAVAASATVFTPSCGSSAVGGYTAKVTYGGSGSFWKATLDPTVAYGSRSTNGAFEITHSDSITSTAALATFKGYFERLDSGFLRLTVGECSETSTGNCPAAAEITAGTVQAYALDIPGYVLILKPIGSSGGDIIPMVAIGACPSADFNGAYVVMQDSNTGTPNYSTEGLVGTVAFTASNSSIAVNASTYTAAGGAGSGSSANTMTVTCSEGLGSVSGAEMMFTNAGSGGAIVHTGGGTSHSQAIILVPSVALTVSDFAGDYIGLAFDEGDNSTESGGSTKPLSATLVAAGTGTGAVMDDVVTGAASTTQTANLTFANLSTPVNGVALMTISGGGPTQSRVCVASKNVASSGQNVIFCSGPGMSGGAVSSAKQASYLLVSKP